LPIGEILTDAPQVRDGITVGEIDKGIREWRKKHGHEVGKK
jgi:hypothetical protein